MICLSSPQGNLSVKVIVFPSDRSKVAMTPHIYLRAVTSLCVFKPPHDLPYHSTLSLV